MPSRGLYERLRSAETEGEGVELGGEVLTIQSRVQASLRGIQSEVSEIAISLAGTSPVPVVLVTIED